MEGDLELVSAPRIAGPTRRSYARTGDELGLDQSVPKPDPVGSLIRESAL
jgi:hypothetical protein